MTNQKTISIVLVTEAGGCERVADKPIINNVTERADGTLWYRNIQPLINGQLASDADLKHIKAGKYDLVSASCLLKLGVRLDGSEVITLAEYDRRYAPIAKAKEQAAKVKALRTLTVHLSTCGWGDFSSVEWSGDVDTPVEQIVAECQKMLQGGHDVDFANQTDAEIVAKIEEAKAQRVAKLQNQDEAYTEAQAIVDSTTAHTKQVAKQCGFDAEQLHDDIDHPDYWSVAQYVHALEVISLYESSRPNGGDA